MAKTQDSVAATGFKICAQAMSNNLHAKVQRIFETWFHYSESATSNVFTVLNEIQKCHVFRAENGGSIEVCICALVKALNNPLKI